jgi:hypothetical protein
MTNMENTIIDIYNPASLKSLCFKTLVENKTDLKFVKSLKQRNSNFYYFISFNKEIREEYFQYMYSCCEIPKFYNFLPILESFRLFLLKNKLLYVLPYSVSFDNVSDKSAKIISDSLIKETESLLSLNLQEIVEDGDVSSESSINFCFFNKEKETNSDSRVRISLTFDSAPYELSLCIEKNFQSDA